MKVSKLRLLLPSISFLFVMMFVFAANASAQGVIVPDPAIDAQGRRVRYRPSLCHALCR